MDETDDMLNIDSLFDEEIQSSMIFIFISCIIALLAFLFLLFLCFKHDKLRKIVSIYMASPQTATALLDNLTRHGSDISMYVLPAVCLTLLLYAIIKVLVRCHRQFRRYHMTIYFYCMHGYNKVLQLPLSLN